MFAVIFITANICFCNAQDIIQVREVKGSAFIYGDVSENQARERAIGEAKKEALNKAHIAEHINAYEQLFTVQGNSDFAQFFNSDVQSEIQGAVTAYTIVSEDKKINSAINQIEYSVIINAEVIKYNTQVDFSFKVLVDSIQPLYKNGDKLTFSVKTTQDCFLTIFNVTDHDASVMYPNIIEKDQFIQKEDFYRFPRKSTFLDYELETNKKDEINRLIFVFTKKRIPFLEMNGNDQNTNNEQIMTWLYSIPPDQRCTYYQQFHILRN